MPEVQLASGPDTQQGLNWFPVTPSDPLWLLHDAVNSMRVGPDAIDSIHTVV
jgi:hypothetical protein